MHLRYHIFKETKGTNKAVQLIMITTHGVKKNKYSAHIQNEVVMSDLFEKA